MNLTDMSSILKKDDSINFIAMAITPLHAIGISAIISKLLEEGIIVKGYILLTKHPDTGYGVSEANFHFCCNDIKFATFQYEYSENKGIFKKNIDKVKTLLMLLNKNTNKQFYIVWTEVFSNLFTCLLQKKQYPSINFYRIDDGAATYMNEFGERLAYLRFKNRSNILSSIKCYSQALYYSLFSKLFRKCLLNKKGYISATIFNEDLKRRNGTFKKNNNYVPYYIDEFKKCCSIKENSIDFKGAILVNTQCLVEGGITDGQIEMELYKEFTKIVQDLGIKIMFKAHPRETDISKYEQLGWFNIGMQEYSQESLLANSSIMPLCIVSIYSSTLLNAWGLYDIPVISLAYLLKGKEISAQLKNQLNSYISIYANIFRFPKNLTELKKNILDISKE